ncbi:MAG: TrbG/VirB9 family P-type conjugative transfer protein [Verrucomicrobiae bacterium]|nr:TrbG/VirB9 family P-type conjugative transfer protein [Verrucomicrobiae bacterium]
MFAQEVQTVDLYTSQIHPLNARLGCACIIQLPVEPIATNVGDPVLWLVEKAERLVSIKPTQDNARDTTLAIVTRSGTINFAVHFAAQMEPFTPMVRVTKIIDDSKPLPFQPATAQETLAEIFTREIRIVQNFHALQMVNSPDLRNLEHWTLMYETQNKTQHCTLLQTFRFRDTRHVILHFLTQNRAKTPLAFDVRHTTVSLGETLFNPIAISLGNSTLPPKRTSENFVILDGSNGLSHRQNFEIFPTEIQPIDP